MVYWKRKEKRRLLVEFRKRLIDEIRTEINEMIAEYNSPQEPPPSGGDDPDSGSFLRLFDLDFFNVQMAEKCRFNMSSAGIKSFEVIIRGLWDENTELSLKPSQVETLK